MALESFPLEGSVQVKVTVSSFLTVVDSVSFTFLPDIATAETILLEPPDVTAKAEVAAVVEDKASL